MRDQFAIGDLVKNTVGTDFAIVQRIYADSVGGNFRRTPEEAEDCATGQDYRWWANLLKTHAVVVRPVAVAVTSSPVSGGCSCPWSLLARGCECGAIKPYKIVIGG
jgi:hypothetical protein